jgi:hypothetical protein
MTSFYTNHIQAQVESNKFVNSYVTDHGNELNYQQSTIKLSNRDFLKVQDAFLDRVRPIRLGGAFKILEYIVRKSGNLTGSIYRAQATIARDNGYSLSHTQRHLYKLEKLGLILVTPAGYQKSNIYMYNYHLLNDDPATVGRCGTAAPLSSAKPDITTITSSNEVLTTLKFKKEVSINTNNETNFSINDFSEVKEEPEVVFETTEPVPIEAVSFRRWTLDDITKKVGLDSVGSYEFLERMEKAYRYKYKDGTTRTIDHWNADFNKYCQLQRHWERIKGSRRIDPLKRLIYNENRTKVDDKASPPVIVKAEPTLGDNIKMKGETEMTTIAPWTEEENHEAAIQLAALLKKLGGKPAKDTLAWEYYIKENLLTPSLDE